MFARHTTIARSGITMVESLIAVAVTTVSGAAILTSLSSAMQSSTLVAQRQLTRGLAQQLMDEIASTRFPKDSDTRPTATSNRLDFNDIDDYIGWSASPLLSRQGIEIGTEGQWSGTLHLPRLDQLRPSSDLMRRLTREVLVERIVPDNSTGWATTNGSSAYRRVTVSVFQIDGRGEQTAMSQISGVFCDVPYAP